MSEPTPPPPIPPAPPSSIAPPPGYVAYQGTDFSQGGLRRTRGLATAIIVLLAVDAIGQVVSLATAGSVRDAAREYLIDGDEDAFNESLLVSGLGSTLAGLAMLATVIVSIIWLHRVISNHQRLGRLVTWTPGWAIAGWLLPPFLFVIPLLMLRETWKASEPQSQPGAPTWKSNQESPLPWVWFFVYSVGPLILGIIGSFQLFSSFDRDLDNVAERLIDDMNITIANGLLAIAAALVWGLLTWSLTRRHTQLTGEANAR